uniref:Uncharacterized protein n=1 Tax=Anguilla anguilla TaxID=7936 RepID=A0A0E9P765_ANGAN
MKSLLKVGANKALFRISWGASLLEDLYLLLTHKRI